MEKRTFDVTIEETVCQTFTIKAKTLEEAIELVEKQYRDGDIYVSDGEVQGALISGYDDEKKEYTDWREI